MILKFYDQRGFSLAELLVAGVILSVVFVAAASLHVTSLKFLENQQRSGNLSPLITLNYLSRSVKSANEVLISGTGKQLSVRIEGSDPPTVSTADDPWEVYGIIGGKLYWRTFAAGVTPTDVTASDPELLFNLPLDTANSSFTFVNPSTAVDATKAGSAVVVNIKLVTQEGKIHQTQVAPSGKPK